MNGMTDRDFDTDDKKLENVNDLKIIVLDDFVQPFG
jgi:hypothetical protein